jgi:tRNA threonylcarbamoyladenosine biosynthesis protein TsaB
LACFLHIETATGICSVALSKNGNLLAVESRNEGYKHAENILVLVEKIKETAGIDLSEIDAVVVSAGPGSYTGLRIGMSTAKGICYALDKKLITVDTLEIIAAGYRRNNHEFTGLILPMLDARRMEVYAALFDESGSRLMENAPVILDENSFSDLHNKHIAIIGDGAAKFSEIAQAESWTFEPSFSWDAQDSINMANEAFEKEQFADLAYAEPNYLKPFYTTAKPVQL